MSGPVRHSRSLDSFPPTVTLRVDTVNLNRGQTITIYLNPNEPFQAATKDVQSVELRVRHDGTLELFVSTDNVGIREWSDGWTSLEQEFNASRAAASEPPA